jgi:hypothetical protein
VNKTKIAFKSKTFQTASASARNLPQKFVRYTQFVKKPNGVPPARRDICLHGASKSRGRLSKGHSLSKAKSCSKSLIACRIINAGCFVDL